MVWHRIVEATGCRSLAEAAEHVSGSEFLRWRAYFDLHPWSEREAMLAMHIVMASGPLKRAPTVADFMPGKPRLPVSASTFFEKMKKYG